ncbi:MAG TPA: PTS sugar transporter subunit IIA [Spirochaetaceae bacterium]|nr:PTS sugar transporter subunit IIA [Spirochaetaceae bacterium]
MGRVGTRLETLPSGAFDTSCHFCVFLDTVTYDSLYPALVRYGRGDAAMILQKAFNPATIKIGLESEDKAEVLEELTDLLSKNYLQGQTFPREAVLEALWAREKKMSTGIYKGIAVPHATVEGIDTLRGVLGISKKGIDYESLDGSPVYLVFLLVSPPGEAEQHLNALKKIALLIQDPLFLENVLEASTPQKVYSIIQEFEERL